MKKYSQNNRLSRGCVALNYAVFFFYDRPERRRDRIPIQDIHLERKVGFLKSVFQGVEPFGTAFNAPHDDQIQI